jgi:hypothetical protein
MNTEIKLYERSASTKNLKEAIKNIRKEIGLPSPGKPTQGKTAKGKTISYWGMELNDLLKKIEEPCEKEGVTFTCITLGHGMVLNRVEHGEEYEQTITKVYDPDTYVQRILARITSIRKYFIYGILNIHPQSDDDGNAEIGNQVSTSHGAMIAEKQSQAASELHDKVIAPVGAEDEEPPLPVKKEFTFDQIADLRKHKEGRPDDHVEEIIQHLSENGIRGELELVASKTQYLTLKEYLKRSPGNAIKNAIQIALKQAK